MRKNTITQKALLAVLLWLLLTSQILAGVSGKISGRVLNTTSKEPVEGATIRLLGTNLVTKTDMDGEFFVINVPSGKYDVAVSFVGYEPLIKKGVRVLVDLTTPLNFSISDVAVALPGEVVVYADNPVIKKDLTESKVIFTADQLKNLPNIVAVQSVISNYPGVVTDRDNDIHVRGGRSGQVTYHFDGFSIQDPFTSNSGIRVIPSALEELSLTSGGFSAEYGEALSGVVSAVTREGGAQYHGGLKMYQSYGHKYDVTQATWSKLRQLDNRSAIFNFSGPIPGLDAESYTFYAAGEYLNDQTALPHNGMVSYTGTAKLAVSPARNIKLKANLTFQDASGDLYEHRDVNGRSYDLNLDGLNSFKKRAHLIGFTGTYVFSERYILSTIANSFHTQTKNAPGHLMNTYWDKWPGYSEDAFGNYNGTIQNDNYAGSADYTDERQIVGFTVGNDFDPRYKYRESGYNAFNVNFLAQLNKAHQVKTGFEYRRYNIEWDNKQFYNLNPYGEKYKSTPLYSSFYIQDKMEYRDFVINLGVRYDYRDADISYNSTPLGEATYHAADSKSEIAPRLGVSFPISEKSVMHFNYGIYYQVPRFTYTYTNLEGDVTTGLPLIGNPNLEPERTASYEIGLNHLIGDDLKLNATAYYKDIDDLVSTRSSYIWGGGPVTEFTNDDYGSVTGFDLALEKLPRSSNFSGSVSYGYMTARGNGSYALEPYYTWITSLTDNLAPVKEYALDFDQRHTANILMAYNAPADWKSRLFGMTIPGAWALSAVGRYGSGLPYTATDANGNRIGELNESRLPSNYQVDMRFNKQFDLIQSGYVLGLYVEVDNLFNRRNVINVYSKTGQANNDGYSVGGDGLSLSQDDIAYYDRLYDHDPQNYSQPRTVRVGMEVNF